MRSRRLLCVIVAAMLILVALPVASQNTRREMIVSSDWLSSRLDGKVLLVDVADKDEYEKGHIPSARLLEKKKLLVDVNGVPNEVPPVADFEALMTGLGIGDEKRIVLYSRDPLLATRAWFTLDYMGHGTRASVLDGGFAGWVADGKQVATDVPVFEPVPFHASPNQAAITNLKVMKTLIQARSALGDSLAVIDARPRENYRGELAGTGVARPGHIPGAINVFWQENLKGQGNNAKFRSDDELRALYTKLGVNRGTTVITYCRTGVEASMTYFVLRYLGFDPSLYDGSFVEWSGNHDTPVG